MAIFGHYFLYNIVRPSWEWIGLTLAEKVHWAAMKRVYTTMGLDQDDAVASRYTKFRSLAAMPLQPIVKDSARVTREEDCL